MAPSVKSWINAREQLTMQLTWQALALLVCAAVAATLLAAGGRTGPINITVDPKEAYVEIRGTEQRLNFDQRWSMPPTMFPKTRTKTITLYTLNWQTVLIPLAWVTM